MGKLKEELLSNPYNYHTEALLELEAQYWHWVYESEKPTTYEKD